MKKFRWKKGELEKLDKEIKKFNSRRNTLIKQGFDENILPEKMNYYKTRDYIIANKERPRQYLEEQFKIIDILKNKKNTTIDKAERGAKIPHFVKKIADIKINAINKEREQLRNHYQEIEKTSLGKKIHPNNKKDMDEFRPKKVNWDRMSSDDLIWNLKTYTEYDKTQADRARQYRESFYKAMVNQMTYEEFTRLKPTLDLMTDEEILEQYYKDTDMNIKFFYDESDREDRMEAIISSWNDIAREKGYMERND